ncbi:hypothetical protein AtNW77_Chr2g0247731 [Arabidopsis thaliana]
MIKECLGTAPENQTDLLVPRDIWFCSPDLIPSIREGDIRGAQCFGFKHLQISNHPLIFLELLSISKDDQVAYELLLLRTCATA